MLFKLDSRGYLHAVSVVPRSFPTEETLLDSNRQSQTQKYSHTSSCHRMSKAEMKIDRRVERPQDNRHCDKKSRTSIKQFKKVSKIALIK